MPNYKLLYSRLLRFFILAAVIWFVVGNFEELARYDFQLQWSFLAVGLVFTLIAYLASFHVWISLSAAFGLRASYLVAGRAWFLSQLGKYVPGKIALLLVRFDAYRGCSKRKITVATSIEYISTLAGGTLLVLLAMATLPVPLPSYYRWIMGFSVLLFGVFLWPPLLQRSINLVLKKFNKEAIEEFPSYGHLLRFVIIYFFTILLYGVGFFLVFRSLTPISIDYFLAIAGACEAAALIGIAAVFAPSGIGVREGVLFLVLPAFMPLPAVIVGTIMIRLVVTLAELCWAAFFYLLERHARDKSRNGMTSA